MALWPSLNLEFPWTLLWSWVANGSSQSGLHMSSPSQMNPTGVAKITFFRIATPPRTSGWNRIHLLLDLPGAIWFPVFHAFPFRRFSWCWFFLAYSLIIASVQKWGIPSKLAIFNGEMMIHHPFSNDISDHGWTPPKNSNKSRWHQSPGQQEDLRCWMLHFLAIRVIALKSCFCVEEDNATSRSLRYWYLVLQCDNEMEHTLIRHIYNTNKNNSITSPCEESTVRYGAMIAQTKQAKHSWFAGSICYLSGRNLFAAHQPSLFRSGQSVMIPLANYINCWIPPGNHGLT